MSTKERFNAAVNVINGLPKHGPYQPSNEMKLSFYAFYKQAMEGPNAEAKPWSWEVVKKAKWDAWKKLGEMPRDEAMSRYVEELNKIVETMSYTENVADFLKSMDESQESDKDMITSEFPKPAILPPDTPVLTEADVETAAPISEDSIEEDDDEMYIDSLDSTIIYNKNSISDSSMVIVNGCSKQDTTSEQQASTTDILMRTVLTLRTELNEITASVRKMELKQKSLSRRSGLFVGLSNETIAFIFVWPITVHFVLTWLFHRKRFR